MTQEISEEKFKKLLKGIHIPPQPQIMVDLQMEMLMLMPDVSIDNLSKIITKDIGMSGFVLKVVNSPFFGLRNKITSIKQALSLLGVSNIVNIANSMSIRNCLSDDSIVQLTSFWDNATDTAMIAAAVAKMLGISTTDEAYTLGLFHNAGIPLLLSKFEQYPQILKISYVEQNRRITDIENDQIDCNHAVVGYYVANTWKLPSYLSEAIADHHKTEDIFSDKVGCEKKKKNLLATLKLAETISGTYQTLGDEHEDYEFQRIKSNLLQYVGLSEYDFEELHDEIREMGLIHHKLSF